MMNFSRLQILFFITFGTLFLASGCFSKFEGSTASSVGAGDGTSNGVSAGDSSGAGDEATGGDTDANRGIAGVGSASGGQVVPDFELTSLNGSNGGFKLTGRGSNSLAFMGDSAGLSIASGDINGDGYSDVVVGSPNADPGFTIPTNANGGKVSVVFGGPRGSFNSTGAQGISLSNLNGTNGGFQISGYTNNSSLGYLGTSVGSCDVNGDGFAEVLAGRFANATNDQNFSVLKGGANLGTSLSGVSGSDGFFIFNIDGLVNGFGLHFFFQNDTSGNVANSPLITGGGDINNDGYCDVLIANPYADANAGAKGQSFVIFGNSSTSALNAVSTFATPLNVSGNSVLKFKGSSYSGTSIKGIGDFNNDGFEDFAIGASWEGVSYSGKVYVIFGGSSVDMQTHFSNSATTGFDLTTLGTGLSASHGFVLYGSLGNQIGYSVNAAGDVNADGFDDVIIGAPGASPNSFGNAYIVFGKSNGIANINLDTLNGNDGIKFNGFSGARLGISVSSAGDFNHDGFSDVLIGSASGTANSGANKVYLIFGGSSLNLKNLHGNSGFEVATGTYAVNSSNITTGIGRVFRGASNSQTGLSVSPAGDVDNDGFDDILIGAPSFTGGHHNAPDPFIFDQTSGQVYIVYGH